MVHHGHARSLTPERDGRRPARAQRATKRPRRRARTVPPHCAQKPRSAHTERGLRAPTATPRRGIANSAPFAPPPMSASRTTAKAPLSTHRTGPSRADSNPAPGHSELCSLRPPAHVCLPDNSESPAQHTPNGAFARRQRPRAGGAERTLLLLSRRSRPPPCQQQSPVRFRAERGFFHSILRPQGSCTRGKPASSFSASSSGSTPSEASLLRSEATAEAVA